MSRTSTLPLTDRLLDGNLAQMLRGWREAGESFESIARKLDAEHGVVITKSTVARWCDDLGIPARPAEPASGVAK